MIPTNGQSGNTLLLCAFPIPNKKGMPIGHASHFVLVDFI